MLEFIKYATSSFGTFAMIIVIVSLPFYVLQEILCSIIKDITELQKEKNKYYLMERNLDEYLKIYGKENFDDEDEDDVEDDVEADDDYYDDEEDV